MNFSYLSWPENIILSFQLLSRFDGQSKSVLKTKYILLDEKYHN
jgi:hypothetical protein